MLEALGLNMRLTVRWRDLAAVVKDAWPIGLAVGGVVVAITVACFLSTTPSAAVRYTGMILQIAGLSTVTFGLRDMRRLFERPSVRDKVFGWFGRFGHKWGQVLNLDIRSILV